MNTTTTDTSHFNSPVALERRERIHSAAADIAKAHASHGTMKAAIHAVDSEHTTISYTELALLWQGVNAHYILMRETATTAPAQQAEPATTANATQVGGNHYASKAIQPWDVHGRIDRSEKAASGDVCRLFVHGRIDRSES